MAPSADSSALDIFNKILRLPARYNGLPVRGESNFVMKFRLKKFEKPVKKRGYRLIVQPYLPVDDSYRIYKPSETDEKPKPLTKPYRSLKEMILAELEYPDEALKKGIQGTVRLSFVVEVNGLPSNIHVIDGVGGGCTDEAVAVVENIRWLPAIKGGKAVRCIKVLPVTFSLKQSFSAPYIPSQNNTGLNP